MVRVSLDATGKPKRSYLGWEDSATVEAKELKVYEGRKTWTERWGPCTPWFKRYNQWICTDIRRAMRKPSFRSLEWLAYDEKAETAPTGEYRTRHKTGTRQTTVKDYFIEPITHYRCCPVPRWPLTTAGEVGWLSQHKDCQLEIYGNLYMQKPPLPANQPKLSVYLANSQ